MAYSVTLFQNSGFNSVNIPDSPSLLNSVDHVSVDAIQTLQERFLTSIQIKAEWSSVKECDYVKVGSFFYFVDGVTMLSGNTAQLSLTPDFITSAGGLKSNTDLKILDGLTDRQTVSVSSDTWGAYTEEDPLMAPQQPLQIATTWGKASDRAGTDPFDALSVSGDPVLLESTIDLAKQAAFTKGTTYISDGGECTVPQTYGLGANITRYDLNFDGNTDTDATLNNGTCVYLKNSTIAVTTEAVDGQETLAQGIASARSLGIDGGIINQWSVPREFIDGISIASAAGITGDDGKVYTNVRLSTIAGRAGTCTVTDSTNLDMDYASPRNKRVLYGECNKYGIITASGSSCEFKPEEVGDGTGLPSISFRADPRKDGKPYYRFTSINGDTEFWRNCISGESWMDVPFVYQGASGTVLNRLNFDNQRYIENVNYQYSDAELTRGATTQYQANSYQQQLNNLQMIQNTGSGLLGAFSNGSGGSIGDLARGALSGFTSGAQYGLNSEYLQAMARGNQAMYQLQSSALYARYQAALQGELSQLYQANKIYIPTVNFPFDANIIRDVKGNGFMLYKYRYSSADITRIDKILTMYGYKETEPLTKSNFNRRPQFDFVSCSSVSVGGFPRWMNDGISAQLRAGVRIWHVLPTVSAYTDNVR